MSLDFFLTAFDPSDLPGSSIDPLGFERGYLFLADKILPGLTNVAARPRYFGVLCAGIHLAEVSPTIPSRVAYERRRDVLLRLERLWALANVLASTDEELKSDTNARLGGIRGLRYVQAYAATLKRRQRTQTTPDFRVLSRQAQYGVLGIYAAVAQGMRILSDRRQLSLTPDIGDALAEAFISETEMPRSLLSAIRDNKAVSIAELTAWGARAHVSETVGAEEGRRLKMAVSLNDVRIRMVKLLGAHKAQPGESELQRLERIRRAIKNDEQHVDLMQCIRIILAYEATYRIVQLGLERLLWLARTRAGLTITTAAGDEIMIYVCRRMAGATAKLERAIATASVPRILEDFAKLEDILRFVADASKAADAGADRFIDCVLDRHDAVQRGKFDRGRPKLPWIERAESRITLTSTQVGGLSFEAMSSSDIIPHFYRTAAADALREAARL